jgi:hypothetical protein
VAIALVLCIVAGPAAVIAFATPEYTRPPEVTGRVELGQRLQCASGSWKGTPEFKYAWIREGIEVRTGPEYKLNAEDEHKEIWCIVTATMGSEKGAAESVNGVCLGGECHEGLPPIPPRNEVRPEISPATGAVGKTLTCSQGTWSGRPPPTFKYQWLRNGEGIKSAESSNYTVVSEDETHALSCRVTGENGHGEETVESKNTVTIAGTPPKNTKRPEVLGEPVVNNSLTCYQGTWTGSEPLTFKFQWLRNGLPITGATGSTRIVESADEGQKLSCKVTGENKLGKEEVASANSVTVKSIPLENTLPPEITGTPAEEGHTLTCGTGLWNQPTAELKFKYQWLRDKTTPVGFVSQYIVANADRGHLLYCQVEAKNEKKAEHEVALSEPVGVQKGTEVPKNETRPVVEGVGSPGNSLTCKPGSWSNLPITQYVYQWVRAKIAIASATQTTYMVKTADRGYDIGCKVIAENAEGPSEPAESFPTHIAGEAPNGGDPEVVGFSPPRVGETLTCVPGEWKGTPTPKYKYEWLRDGAGIGESTAYTIVSADRGHSLSCRVTASNTEGSASASSERAFYVRGEPPLPPLAGPTISGEPALGKELECVPGTWAGAPTPTFTYQWLLNGSNIPGATSPMFAVGGADRGFTISCRVTGTSSEGTASALSKGVHIAGSRPEAIEQPFISGSAVVGQNLTCQRGIWNGKPPPSFTYQWFRDGVAITSATESAYAIEPGDQGHLLSCNVTARNSEGSQEAESYNGVVIKSHQSETVTEKPLTGSIAHVVPSAAVILASLNRQLSFYLSGVHLKSVLKAGGWTIQFIAPTAGTLEVLWYVVVKGAHGSKNKQIVLAQSTTIFSGSRKATIKVKLTSKGRQLLNHKKRMSLKVRAAFTIPHVKPVIWAVTHVLSR